MSAYYSGSGLFEYRIDRSNKIIGIDVSGQRDGLCFRNDYSVFLLVANSYFVSSELLINRISEDFNSGKKPQDIFRCVIPFFFNMRHYIELELKALIMHLNSSPAKNTHDVLALLNDLQKCMQDLKTDNPKSIVSKDGKKMDFISQAIDILPELQKNIKAFLEDEASVEYYRYIFNTKHEIRKTRIEFDCVYYNDLMNIIHENFFVLMKNLHLGGVCIFNP